MTRFDVIEIDIDHRFCEDINTVALSPYLQSRLVYVGQLTNYREGVNLIKMFHGIDICQSQLFRITNYYGELSSTILDSERPIESVSNDECVYWQCDGSMILTREDEVTEDEMIDKEANENRHKETKDLNSDNKEQSREHSKGEKLKSKRAKSQDSKETPPQKGGWREVKLGRLFKSKSRLECKKRTWIESSQYIAHIGSNSEFEEKAERLIDPFEHLADRLVCISDGAPWIIKWLMTMYPQATFILDFFHVLEHLSSFAQLAFEDPSLRKKWFDECRLKLLNSETPTVIEMIQKVANGKSKIVIEAMDRLCKYYKTNLSRMDYKSYQERELFISSGAIEAANRNVIQKRMKQSGQRWTVKNAQKVINLRACVMSDKWEEVVSLIRKSAA